MPNAHQDAPTEWVSIEEFSRHVGVSKPTVRRWIAQGRITAYRLGPQLIRINRAEADSQLCRPIPTARTAQ